MHAAWNALLKGRPGSDPAVMSAALSLSWVLLGIPLVLVLPAPSPASLPYLLASVAVHVVYFGPHASAGCGANSRYVAAVTVATT